MEETGKSSSKLKLNPPPTAIPGRRLEVELRVSEVLNPAEGTPPICEGEGLRLPAERPKLPRGWQPLNLPLPPPPVVVIGVQPRLVAPVLDPVGPRQMT